MSAENPLFVLLEETNVHSLVQPEQEVVSVVQGEPLKKLVKVFRDRRILSVPVLEESGNCLGFVDTLDLACFLKSKIPDDTNEYLRLLASGDTKHDLCATTARHVIDHSGKDRMVFVSDGVKCSTLGDFFSRGYHRVAVFDKDVHLVATVSQSDIVRLVLSNVDGGWSAADDVLSRSIDQLGLVFEQKPVYTVSLHDSIFTALTTLTEKKCSGLAVLDLDRAGVLVGNFSASDMKGLYNQKVPHLETTVKEFLSQYSESSLNPVVAYKRTSLLNVLRLMATEKIHHVWVVDEDRKPIGVVSMTDVMSTFMNQKL